MAKFYVYISIFIAQLSGLITSTCMTWSSPILVKLNGTDDNPLGGRITSGENSFLAAAPTLGACFGTILCGLLVPRLGRKTILTGATVIPLIFNLVMAFATNIWYFYISRLLTGLSLGLVFPVLPMYNGEIAHVTNRGIVGAFMIVFITSGVMLPFILGIFCSFFWFHIILAILPAIFIPLSLVFLLESPHYLIDRDYSKAREILRKIREENEIDDNIEDIRKSSQYVPEGTFSDLFRNRGVRKAMFIGFGMSTFMQLTGNALIFTYCQRIFEEAGSSISADLCPIILGAAQFVTAFFTAPLNDRFSRKFLLIFSYIGITLTEIPLGLQFFLSEHGNEGKSYSYIPIICLLSNVIFYNLGVGPIGGTMLSEVFPLSVKGKAIPLLVLYNCISAFAITFLFNTLNDVLGLGIIFWLFSGCSLVGAVFIKLYVVETKGRTLEEIQRKINE